MLGSGFLGRCIFPENCVIAYYVLLLSLLSLLLISSCVTLIDDCFLCFCLPVLLAAVVFYLGCLFFTLFLVSC